MNDAERAATGAAIRKANKGPADAVIREASDAEIDAAFNDTSGDRGPSLPGASKVGGPGGKGSTAGIRTGSKEAGGGLDVRAAENLRIRAARRAAQGLPPPAGTVRPPAPQPVQAPQDAPLEDWEIPPETPAVAPEPVAQARPAAPARDYYADFPPGDRLAVAQMDALAILGRIPEGFELFVGGGSMDPEGIALVMGLGFLIGKGYAAYRGDNHYRLTAEGREAYLRGEYSHA